MSPDCTREWAREAEFNMEFKEDIEGTEMAEHLCDLCVSRELRD